MIYIVIGGFVVSRVNIIYDVFVSSPGDIVEGREIIGRLLMR